MKAMAEIMAAFVTLTLLGLFIMAFLLVLAGINWAWGLL